MKRIEDLDRSREVESVRLQEARDRLQRLQQEATVSVPPAVVASNASPEVVRLQNIVSQLQAQLAKSEGGVVEMVTDGVQESPLKKGRVRPENFVCQTVEEVLEWMNARQSVRHASRCRKWQCPRSQQVGSHVGRGCFTVEELDYEPIDGEQHGWVIFPNRKGPHVACGARKIRSARREGGRGVSPRSCEQTSSDADCEGSTLVMGQR